MSASKICPQCNNEYPLDQRFCPLDGATLKTQGGANDLVGSVVADRYYVLRKLGEGGMGQVYLAEHVRMGRKAALKVMLPSMVQDADAISRFNREAANASRISHPNVAAIYDFGETGDGLIYLAMEFVEGEALTSMVERTGALPPLRAADIIRQTGDALQAAHDMAIVHRDLKPDNIMIAKNRDGSDCVKVVDFGIAKSNEGSQKVTKTGLVVGTPEYMSPEQLAGDKLDGRSDIYSLALVAFNLLTGKLPFPSESAQESMIMRLTDKPKRLGEMASHVTWPEALQAVMDRGMERDAKLRYASAAEFGRDFARAVESMPETATMTAGTQVLDATAIVPPTRVAAAESGGATAVIGTASGVGLGASGAGTLGVGSGAPLAPAPSKALAPGGRTPMLAAAAVIVVLGIGAAAMKFVGASNADAQGTGDTAAAMAESAAAPEKTEVGTAADSAPASSEQFADNREKAVPSPGTVRAPAADVNRPQPRPESSSGPSLQKISDDLDRAWAMVELLDTLQAPAALRIVQNVEQHLVTRPHILQAGMTKGHAYAAVGNYAQACRAYRNVQHLAAGTRFEKDLNTALANCP